MQKLGPVLVVLAFSFGCGDDAEAVCEKILDCLGNEDSDVVDECARLLREDSDNANEAGCSDEYDAYLACADAEDSCDELTSRDLCAAEFKAVQRCE